uniref:zinc finger protein ZAT1-like n=1 Tax=Erigeron canadensis TaxID=72917 RepID=UPI001CB95BCF|nr:zinc finger protein ZAT1-like [Erigeron canadensis]
MKFHMINSSDHNKMENKSVFDKICKKCGKGFQSWKALFGHMKCHSTKLSSNKNKNIASFRQDSCTSHSNNENSDSKKHRIKRSRSRNKRYMVASTTTSSSISMNVNNNHHHISSNNASTSMVSEIEEEQEADVAMSLMMLSRDLGKWGNELESSYVCNSSVLVSLVKHEDKDLTKSGCKMKKLAEPQASLDSFEKSKVGFIKSSELDLGFGIEYENSSKRKYDCVTCNKSFHSSQALSGHKASHKKVKRAFDTKIRSKIKIEHKPMLDYDQITKGHDSKECDFDQEPSSFNLGVGFLKKKTVGLGTYECPICFKIFSSGQALGGHKRAHLISEAKQNQGINTNVTKKADEHLPKTRGFLDLNMPPEEEMTSSTTEYKPYYLKDINDHHKFITMNQDY